MSQLTGWGNTKHFYTIKYFIDKMTQKTNEAVAHNNQNQTPIQGTLEKSVSDANEKILVIANQQAVQVMMPTPTEATEKY